MSCSTTLQSSSQTPVSININVSSTRIYRQTGIRVHTCMQFVINRDLCPHNLWQTGICVDIHAFGYIDKDDSLILKHIPLSQLFVYLRFYIALWQIGCQHNYLVYRYRSLFVTNCVETSLFSAIDCGFERRSGQPKDYWYLLPLR
jgi:hypothetical protein